MKDDLERSILAAVTPRPAEHFREQVLTAAMPLVRPDDSRLDRLWFSARWRAAAALALLALGGLDVWSPRVASWEPLPQDLLASAGAEATANAAREAGLTEAEAAIIAAQVGSANAHGLEPEDRSAQ
jgi:hypothetical protein